jgi:hypothetical protein
MYFSYCRKSFFLVSNHFDDLFGDKLYSYRNFKYKNYYFNYKINLMILNLLFYLSKNISSWYNILINKALTNII